MRKNVFTVAVLFMVFAFTMLHSTGQAHAQNALAIRGGGNYNYLGYDFEEGYGDRFGYTFGLAGMFSLTPFFILNPELAFSRRNIELYKPVYLEGNPSFIDSDLLLGLNYIDVPLHVGYGYLDGTEQVGEGSMLLVYAGPQLSFLSSQENKLLIGNNSTDPGEFDSIRSTIVALNLGISLGYQGFYADVRYSLPINSLLKSDHRGDRLHTMALSIGYALRF